MAKSKLISRIGALALAAALACTSLISASAATIDTYRNVSSALCMIRALTLNMEIS